MEIDAEKRIWGERERERERETETEREWEGVDRERAALWMH